MIKYLALGDSYTIGEAVPQSESWPHQLAGKLQQHLVSSVIPEIIASTGWTTGELLKAIEATEPASEYHLVSLLIGVNNQYRSLHPDIFLEEFTRLLQKAIYYARKKPEGVFVLSIPDYGVTPFAAAKDPRRISEEIEGYNFLCKSICSRLDVAYYDITDISRKAAIDNHLLAGDGLHPSGAMYEQWVEQIFPHVVKQIRLLQKV